MDDNGLFSPAEGFWFVELADLAVLPDVDDLSIFLPMVVTEFEMSLDFEILFVEIFILVLPLNVTCEELMFLSTGSICLGLVV